MCSASTSRARSSHPARTSRPGTTWPPSMRARRWALPRPRSCRPRARPPRRRGRAGVDERANDDERAFRPLLPRAAGAYPAVVSFGEFLAGVQARAMAAASAATRESYPEPSALDAEEIDAFVERVSYAVLSTTR